MKNHELKKNLQNLQLEINQQFIFDCLHQMGKIEEKKNKYRIN